MTFPGMEYYDMSSLGYSFPSDRKCIREEELDREEESKEQERSDTIQTVKQHNLLEYINLSDFFTPLIKEAAKCIDYSSDVFYDLKRLEEMVRGGMDGKQILAFRDYGVDNDVEKGREYFSIYEIIIEKDKTRPGYISVTMMKTT